MKSIITVAGTFLFSIFVEGFIRVIIIFYHKSEFSFFGISTLPGISWAIIILISILIVSWLSGMLTVTIAGFSPGKHLLALGGLFLLWRLNEIFQTIGTEPVWYLTATVLISFSGLYLSYLTQKKSNANIH